MFVRIAAAAALACLTGAQALAQTPIQIGQEVGGTLSANDPVLTDGSHFDCYVLEPGAGPVTIDMKTAYLDAFLAVGTGRDCGDGMRILGSDDDSGTNTNARLVQTFTAPRILIRANSLSAGETGNYWLSVTAGAPAEEARQGSLSALPQGVSEWGADFETCIGAYRAMTDARSGVERYGNVGQIDYAARARSVDARRPANVTASMADFIASNFVLIALGGVIDDKPDQVAEYLETVAGCDRAFGFTPVTVYR